ncbi:hypothetical protein ZHAS_00009121 [Anopheles sinensis]|uniref:Uncharacterized protein n=1 Tax=Anopheles sinensis TaxID=74873 RepID=A0A084VU74_ANOSI|nr:hypothetical protein ZHAS_00009121 [Anopheles sinensis]
MNWINARLSRIINHFRFVEQRKTLHFTLKELETLQLFSREKWRELGSQVAVDSASLVLHSTERVQLHPDEWTNHGAKRLHVLLRYGLKAGSEEEPDNFVDAGENVEETVRAGIAE